MSWAEPTWPRRWPRPLVVSLATLGPLGRRLPAPGTWGSAAGAIYFLAAVAPLAAPGAWALNLAGFFFAVGICGEAEKRLGRTDPGEVILDEFVALPLCFLGWDLLRAAGPAWAVVLAGFLGFRCFDILKPLGISRLQRLPGGWGVVVDDTAAALATCLLLHGLACWRRHGLG